MKFEPYPIQVPVIEHCIEFFRNANVGDKVLYSGPTGVGKSVIQLSVREVFDDLWILTPREEIMDGFLDKLGVSGDPMDYRITTPLRLRNRLLKGEIEPPGRLIIDESHHSEADTWQQLTLLTGLRPRAGFTATPFRGSPSSTRSFLEDWGEPVPIITYKEAADEGVISMPDFEQLPLVDDDVIEVKGGEFEITSIESFTMDRLGDMADHAKEWYRDGRWDRPTIFALPNTACCVRLQQELHKRGCPCVIVAAATPREERRLAFKATREGVLALLHINIVSEGVDLPLRRLVDLAPTMSPVKWMQQLGRITRPLGWICPARRNESCRYQPAREPGRCECCGAELVKERRPQYVCTNRNLLRHAYALGEGVVPLPAIANAESKFPPGDRACARVLGMEALGRFKPATVKMVDGVSVRIYSLSTVIANTIIEFVTIVHPTKEPIWASKTSIIAEEGKKFGSWKRCGAPDALTGFGSAPLRDLTPKQQAWWERSAGGFGLDPRQKVDRRMFPILPVLCDIGGWR